MASQINPNPDGTRPCGPLRRAARAVRSGVRRYPPALASSVRALVEQAGDGPARSIVDELEPHEFALAWLGHAGVVCTAGPHTMVVDPVLSGRIGPRIGRRTIGLPRLDTAPMPPEALRGLRLVMITHAHFDHLDRPTLERMADRRTSVVVPRGCARLVPAGFASVHELPPGATARFDGLEVSAVEPRHWGARIALDRRRGFNAYIVRGGGASVLFAGDTAHTERFDGLGDLDVAVFGIGAYEPWNHMHATPEEVWRMFERCGARRLLPVHHSTFELGDEPMDEPMRRLLAAAGAARERVLSAAPGEIIRPAHA